ncbi:MAG: hypothetical protein JWL85_364 [Candidatus Saccharibacteria bacterium]|nr:hypothetical protein [Candidatus Saccharibacteria bacterium]
MFHEAMHAAQELHGQRQYEAAQEKWKEAERFAFNGLYRARAIRGDAASADLRGEEWWGYAADRSEAAFRMHDRMVQIREPRIEPGVLRERVESAGVAGRIAVRSVIRRERAGELDLNEAHTYAAHGIGRLLLSLEDATLLRLFTRSIDQHEINAISRVSMALSLYGDRTPQKNGHRQISQHDEAKQLARQALSLGRLSESDQLPTAANISILYRKQAKARAVARGVAAIAVNKLAVPRSGLRRNAALSVAYRMM